MLDISSHDIVLVGGGGAGLRAAIAVAEENPNLSVAVVSKVYPMRSHTVSAEGGAAAVVGADDSLEEHCYDTISGGDWLCDQDAVEAFVNERFHGVLVAQPVAPGNGVVAVFFQAVVGADHRGRAPLRRYGVTAHRVHLGHHCDAQVGIFFRHGDGRPQASPSAANQHNVVR